MLTRLVVAALWMSQPGPVRAAPQTPPTLHCRIEIAAAAKGKDCKVKLPAGRHVRACTDTDRQAGHCDAAGEGRYAAWVVGTGPGRCRIGKKHTKWDRVVVAKLSKSEGAASTCDLYVEVK
ncbi:MAG TPA: hypothetical protein VEK86_14140 [Gemmatimonadales bacterium]|nr:hypothetical protein [Gemmatimonadales bacterium]